MTEIVSGKNIFLRTLDPKDATDAYLGWLNDPDTQRYRTSRTRSTMQDVRNFIERSRMSRDLFLAICLKEGGKHIGGISLSPVDYVHRHAALNILIGDKSEWGKGYAQEAIAALCVHAFTSMGLHKIWSQSANPAFNAVVKKLGWTHEGTKRNMFLLDGAYVDVECYGILESEFTMRQGTRSQHVRIRKTVIPR